MIGLCKRHLLVFFRDKWAVFFTFLSILIILGLFILFMGQMQENSFPEVFSENPYVNYLVYAWILSGVLMVGTVTVPLGFLGNLVRDSETKALHDFYVAPISRTKLILSYLLAAFIATMLLSLFNLTFGLLTLWIISGEMLPVLSIIKVILVIMLLTMTFSSLFYFVISFVKTSNAHGTLSTLTGTLIGFLAGLYVPIGSFSSTIRTILTALPTMQAASLMRRVYMDDAMNKAFGPFEQEAATYARFFGIDISIADNTLTTPLLIVLLIVWGLIFLGLSIKRINQFKKEASS